MKIKSMIFAACLLLSSSLTAQTVDSTGNLVGNVRGTSGHDVWLGTGAAADLGGVHPINVYGCCTSISGASPLLDTSTLNGNGQSGQIIWSYGNTTVNYIVNTVNATATYGSGLRIHGYSWGYELRNMNGDDRQGSVDTLTATSRLWNSTYTGSGLAFESRTHNTKMEWTAFNSTVTLSSPQNLANVGNLQLSFTSGDSGGWAGYYGPQIRNIQARLLYSVDPCVADPQSSPSCPGFKTYYNISDDGYALVPLPFTFPFYGQNFDTSYFQSNGVISFSPGWGFCCSGPNLQSEGENSVWNYTLLPLAIDLIAGNPSSRFYTQSSSSYMRYTWENINQFGTSNLNSFSVEIRPTGYIGFQYDNVNLQNNVVTSGIAGDIAQGQYKQIYHGSGNTFNLTGTYTFTGTEVDQCYVDPLSSITCIGYQQAFYDQQCGQDPLYDSGCPGYYQANYDLQCTINPLYDSGCPGYQQAYFDQQCSISALYSNSCPGYQQAYFDQQCSISALYSNSCPGYQQAYFDQQCSLNALYSNSCPGYAQAYFDQQCSQDPLYSNKCPGYGQAMALKGLKEKQEDSKNDITITENVNSDSTTVADPTRSESVITMDAGGAEISISGEIIVPTGQTEAAKDAVKESEKQEVKKDEDKKRPDPRAVAQARSAVEATNRLAESVAQDAVLLSQLDQTLSEIIGLGSGITVQTFRTLDAEQSSSAQAEKDGVKTEVKNSTAESNMSVNIDFNTKEVPKEIAGSQPTAGPSVRRGGSVDGMEGGADINDLAKAPMDFNSYLNAQIKDSRFYESREIYRGQRTVDNARAQRFLNGASDRLHQEMVDQQYNQGAK